MCVKKKKLRSDPTRFICTKYKLIDKRYRGWLHALAMSCLCMVGLSVTR